MAKADKKADVKPEKKTRPKQQTPSSAGEQFDSLTSSNSLLEQTTLNSDSKTQAHLLNNSEIPIIQRQALADRIGKVQGNRHLQNVMQLLRTDNAPNAIQRHTTTTLEQEENSIQAKRSAEFIQRHTSTQLEYDENSIQAKRAPNTMIQRSLVDKLNDAMDGWGADSQAITNAISGATAAEKREALQDPRIVARLRDELSREDALKALTDLGATLSLRLETAMDGWGAASEEIVKMIESLPSSKAAEKRAVLQNPRLMARLRLELSLDDALKAMKGLGSALSERLNTAMDGWGVDEDAIEKMIREETSVAQKQAAARDRALINRLKSEVSYERLLGILASLGVSFIDRLNVAMDGWGVDSAAILEMSRTATEPEKTRVLGDSATIARLADELSRADALTVMTNLGVSLADRLNTAMNGWGADSATILTMIPAASNDERMAVMGDTATMGRLQTELSEDDFKVARRMLRFGSEYEELGKSFSEEDLDNEELPKNLTAEISTELDSGAPNVGSIMSKISAADDTDRLMVRQNQSLLARLAAAVDEAQMRQILDLLGGSIVDRLNLLLTQEATAADIITLVNNATADAKLLIQENRALLDRVLSYLSAPDDQTFLTALGDSLINQLGHALAEGQDVAAVCTLITAATQDARDQVKVNTDLMLRMAAAYTHIGYWKIRLHLEYGSSANYPAGLSDLITAWETDSSFANIRQTVANLSDTDFNNIKDVVGIREALQGLLNDANNYMVMLRMLDQGLLVQEETVNGTYNETLLQNPTAPAVNFVAKSYTGATGFDVAYFRDRLQVDVKIKADPVDDLSKANISTITSHWESMIEGRWSNVYSVRNANHTLPISINCHFTSSSPHHSINVRTNANPSNPPYNQGNWYDDNANSPTWWYEQAPIHEFGHMLGNPDEYNLSRANYQATVGTDPTTDGQAVPDTDPGGTTRYTNPSVMGSTPTGAAGTIEPRHLNYFVNWVNRNRLTNPDGTFAEPAFTLV